MASFQHNDSICYFKGRLSQQEVISLWVQQGDIITAKTAILDLSQLDYVDSAGVAFLFHLVERQHKQARSLGLANPSSQLQPLIDLYNLQPFFNQT